MLNDYPIPIKHKTASHTKNLPAPTTACIAIVCPIFFSYCSPLVFVSCSCCHALRGISHLCLASWHTLFKLQI